MAQTIFEGFQGGTGANNGENVISVNGNFTMSGAFNFTGTITANTSVTFPTSGTLLSTANIHGILYAFAAGNIQY